MAGSGKYFMLVLMVLSLTACPPPCETGYLNFGSLPDEVYEMHPYEKGESYGFRHSDGQEIYFLTNRDTATVTDYWDECMQVTFGSDNTLMVSQYPIFDIRVLIQKIDSTNVYFSLSIGTSYFELPLATVSDPNQYSFLDSLYLQEQWFRNVYEMIPRYSSMQNPEDILADSLWYNTEFGILKFTMSSGEYFDFIQ